MAYASGCTLASLSEYWKLSGSLCDLLETLTASLGYLQALLQQLFGFTLTENPNWSNGEIHKPLRIFIWFVEFYSDSYDPKDQKMSLTLHYKDIFWILKINSLRSITQGPKLTPNS